MKKFLIILALFQFTISVFSQTGKPVTGRSYSYQVSYFKQNSLPADSIPFLEAIDFYLDDQNHNSAVDPDEEAKLCFNIKNFGFKNVSGVRYALNLLSPEVEGLSYTYSDSIGDLSAGEAKKTFVLFTGSKDLLKNTANFQIVIKESSGYDNKVFNFPIMTHGKNKEGLNSKSLKKSRPK